MPLHGFKMNDMKFTENKNNYTFSYQR